MLISRQGLLAFLFSVSSCHQVPLNVKSSPFDDEFNLLADKTLKFWHVPGISIAVIDGNDTWSQTIIFICQRRSRDSGPYPKKSKGYGIATLPSTPAEASTLYCVGSTTKAFTAATMSLLVDDDEKYPNIHWDTPISEIIRDDFVLTDDYATTHITIEDALSHRSGMPRHDMSYGGPDSQKWTPKDLVRHLRHLPLTAEPRTRWQYCNMMFVVITHVIETLTGSKLENLMQSRILKPLKMESTYFRIATAKEAPEHLAQGYAYYDGTYHEVADFDLSEASGAGFLISNVLDYSNWARSMIDGDGPLSKAGYQQIWSPRMLIEKSAGPSPYTGSNSYALGWETGVYKGYQFFEHGGGMDSYGAAFILFPALRYGVVAFGNTAGTSNYAEDNLIWHLIDERLDIPKSDRFDFNKKNRDRQEKFEELWKTAKTRFYPDAPSPPRPPTLPLAEYTGTYNNPGYQDFTIFLSDSNKLRANRSDVTWKMTVELEHVSGDFFIGRGDSMTSPGGVLREAAPVEFRLGSNGKVIAFGAALEPQMRGEKIWFNRI